MRCLAHEQRSFYLEKPVEIDDLESFWARADSAPDDNNDDGDDDDDANRKSSGGKMENEPPARRGSRARLFLSAVVKWEGYELPAWLLKRRIYLTAVPPRPPSRATHGSQYYCRSGCRRATGRDTD